MHTTKTAVVGGSILPVAMFESVHSLEGVLVRGWVKYSGPTGKEKMLRISYLLYFCFKIRCILIHFQNLTTVLQEMHNMCT